MDVCWGFRIESASFDLDFVMAFEGRCWTLILREAVIDSAKYDVAPTRTSSSRVCERLGMVAEEDDVIASEPDSRWCVAHVDINGMQG